MVFEDFKGRVEKFVATVLFNVVIYMFLFRVKSFVYMAYLKHYSSLARKKILR